MDNRYMMKDILELQEELNIKKNQLSSCKKKITDIETEIVGIKEAIKSKNDSEQARKNGTY